MYQLFLHFLHKYGKNASTNRVNFLRALVDSNKPQNTYFYAILSMFVIFRKGNTIELPTTYNYYLMDLRENFCDLIFAIFLDFS